MCLDQVTDSCEFSLALGKTTTPKIKFYDIVSKNIIECARIINGLISYYETPDFE